MEIERFVENVNKASDLANQTGVTVEKLPDHIQEMEREHSVTMDLMSKTAERMQYRENTTTKKSSLKI